VTRDRHHLLRRQVARLLRDEPLTSALTQFLEGVDDAYHTADEDRRLLERSLELASSELLEQNAALSRALVAEKAQHTRIVRLHDTLGRLATVLARGLPLAECLHEVCREVALALDVERASVWQFDEPAKTMQCLTIYACSGRGPRSATLPLEQHPAYLEMHRTSRVIAIDDQTARPEIIEVARAVGFDDHTAGLSAPCRIAGELVGLLYIADTQGPRVWTAEEKLFATSVSDCISLALESERRQREEQLRTTLEADLRQRQRMDSIGMLAGGIAHDFNNLLVPICGNSELLTESLPTSHPDRELVDEILQAGNSARDLVGQLLAFSRKQVLQLRVVDLAEEARKTSRLLLRALPKNIELELDLEGELLVRADPGQLHQVIINLAVNARDAMPGGGRISVIGRRTTRHVTLVVEDTGTGMDEATLTKVFEPFFTTKSLGRGTGLGLSTAYGIVEQHGGSLTAFSSPGRGSRFEITLPASAPAATMTPRSRRLSIGQREIILLVEDEPIVLAVGRRLLAAAGFTVLPAGGPDEAIAIATSHPEIELVVTDVMMPVMNGVELFSRLASVLPDAGVLYVSGYDSEVLAPQGVLVDGVEFLRKPFSSVELLAAVKRALEQVRVRQRARGQR